MEKRHIPVEVTSALEEFSGRVDTFPLNGIIPCTFAQNPVSFNGQDTDALGTWAASEALISNMTRNRILTCRRT